jgi:hypothetical protein
LEERFRGLRLHRPFQVDRYDAGDELHYEVTPVTANSAPCRVKLAVESFVGGGFAGQVYKVRVSESDGALQETLPVGGTFALKVLIPPSGITSAFRALSNSRPIPRRPGPAHSGRSSFAAARGSASATSLM